MNEDSSLIKIGNVEYTPQMLSDIYRDGRIYLITHDKILQIMFSSNTGFYGQAIYHQKKGDLGFMRRGRFMNVDGTQLNKFLGFDLVNTK